MEADSAIVVILEALEAMATTGTTRAVVDVTDKEPMGYCSNGYIGYSDG